MLRDTAAHAAVDRFLRPLAMVTVAGYLVLAGLSLATGGRFLSLRFRHILSVGLVFAIGPGLLVNGALKNWIGRARPKNIAEFGGERLFSPAYVPADQCLQNCAFVSGDVAFIAAFLAPVSASCAGPSTRRDRRGGRGHRSCRLLSHGDQRPLSERCGAGRTHDVDPGVRRARDALCKGER